MLRRIKLLIMLLLLASCMSAINAYSASPEELFRKDYPAVTLDNIEKTDIDGVYEVFAGGNVFYYHPKTGNIIFGEMITKDYKNVTADRRNTLIAASLKTLPLDKAIRIGTGKNIVIEVVDLDCPYCRKLEEFFDKRNDVSRYVFLFPLDQHPDSMKKSISVLCSSNRQAAFLDMIKGLYDGKAVPACENDDSTRLLEEHKEIARKLGVRGTPTLWINNTPVSGDPSQMERLLTSDLTTNRKEVSNHEKN